MESKILHLIDDSTSYYVIALNVCQSSTETDADNAFLEAAGYGECGVVYMIETDSGTCNSNFTEWDNRTLQEAHFFIQENWDNISSGNTIDVRTLI